MWLNSSAKLSSEEDQKAISKIEQLDLTSDCQFEILFKAFRFSVEAINLWLGMCVFPFQMVEFKSRLKQTAWQLADTNEGQESCCWFLRNQ